MADEWAQYARPASPAGGDEWAQYARQPSAADTGEPGSSPDNPLQEQGVNLEERAAVQHFSKDPAAAVEWLQRAPGEGGKPKSFGLFPNDKGEAAIPWADAHQYDAKIYKPETGKNYIAVRPKGSNEPWKVVDPDTGFFSKDFLGDVMDVLPDIAIGTTPGGGAATLGAKIGEGAAQLGGQAGLLEGGRRAIGKSVLGMKDDSAGDIAKDATSEALMGGAIGGALPVAGAALKGAAGFVGKQIQRPFQYAEATKPKIQDILETISGKKAQDEAEVAAADAAKADRAAKAKQSIEEMVQSQKQREADRAAQMMDRLGKRARSTEESAQFAEEGMNAAEYQKEASRLKDQAKQLAKETQGLPKETAELAQKQIDDLLGKAKEMTTKAQETRSRVGVGRVQVAKRTAEEAAQALEAKGAPRAKPALGGELQPAGEIPGAVGGAAEGAAKAAASSQGRQQAEEEVHQLYQQLRETVHEYNTQAFSLKNNYNRMAAAKVFTWDEVEPIIREIMDSRHQFSQAMHDKVHRAAVAELTKIGLPQDAAVEIASKAKQIGEIKSALGGDAFEPPKLSEIMEKGASAIGQQRPIEDITEEAAKRGTEAALGSVRAQLKFGPGLIRSTYGDLTRGAAFLGYLMENPGTWAKLKPTPGKGKLSRAIQWIKQQATTPQARRALIYAVAKDPEIQKSLQEVNGG